MQTTILYGYYVQKLVLFVLSITTLYFLPAEGLGRLWKLKTNHVTSRRNRLWKPIRTICFLIEYILSFQNRRSVSGIRAPFPESNFRSQLVITMARYSNINRVIYLELYGEIKLHKYNSCCTYVTRVALKRMPLMHSSYFITMNLSCDSAVRAGFHIRKKWNELVGDIKPKRYKHILEPWQPKTNNTDFIFRKFPYLSFMVNSISSRNGLYLQGFRSQDI